MEKSKKIREWISILLPVLLSLISGFLGILRAEQKVAFSSGFFDVTLLPQNMEILKAIEFLSDVHLDHTLPLFVFLVPLLLLLLTWAIVVEVEPLLWQLAIIMILYILYLLRPVWEPIVNVMSSLPLLLVILIIFIFLFFLKVMVVVVVSYLPSRVPYTYIMNYRTLRRFIKDLPSNIRIIILDNLLAIFFLLFIDKILQAILLQEGALPRTLNLAREIAHLSRLYIWWPMIIATSARLWIYFTILQKRYFTILRLTEEVITLALQSLKWAKIGARIAAGCLIFFSVIYLFFDWPDYVSNALADRAKRSGWVYGVQKVCHSPRVLFPEVDPNQKVFLLHKTNTEYIVFTTTVPVAAPTPQPESIYTIPFTMGCSPAAIEVRPANTEATILFPDEQVMPGWCCYQLFGPTPTPTSTPHISLRELNDHH